ncbi:MAG: hypothetical protein J5953_14985 [Prevotella sp.]|nr:hypothetical protein [Prevotella sp.]
MKAKELIVNQYEDRDFLRYNQIKYKTICIVLDFFALCNSIDGTEKIARDDIEKKIFASIKPNKTNRQIVCNSLAAMEIMGYVVEQGNEILIMPDGVIAYREQKIHQIAASLSEAKRVREQTKMTLIISFMAFVVSLLSMIITSCN